MNIRRQILLDLIRDHDSRLVYKASIYLLTALYRRFSFEALYEFIIRHPINVHLLATTRCNRKCPGCVYSDLLKTKHGENFLSPEKLRTVLDSSLFLNAIWVSIKGGEPLLHKDIVQIIRTIKSKKVFASLTTNADFITRDLLEQLHDAGLNWINISYYHDNAQKIREVAAWARGGTFDIDRISVYKHSLQSNEIEAACRCVYEAGLRHFYFGSFNDYAAASIDIASMQKSVDGLDRLYKELTCRYDIDIEMIPPDAHGFLLGSRGRPYCFSGISYMTVAPDLSVAPCCMLEPEQKWGDISSFSACLEFKKRLHTGDIPEICKRCSYLVKR